MVTLKGTKDGLLITLGTGEWPDVLADLASQLEGPRAAQFFHGARARLAAGERALTGGELAELGKLLDQHQMQLDLAPAGAHPRPPARKELPVARTRDKSEIETESDRHEQDSWGEAAMVRRTLRSGQMVRFPGHVIVQGDVNPGAEVIAGGDVIVWGRLRGVVHAGALGDEEAMVCALLLAPVQLRIGSHIARAPDERGRSTRGPEIARVRDGRIVIETWKAKE